jgi:hypothetical protein
VKIAARFILIASLLSLLTSGGWAASVAQTTKADYRAVAGYEGEFVAVTSGGRLDRISASGEVVSSRRVPNVTLNALIFCGTTLVAAGDRGVLYFIPAGQEPRRVKSPITANIRSLALFRGRVVAGADGGRVLVGDENGSFTTTTLAVKGNIVSVSGGALGCYGVTDRGEVIRSDDLVTWDVFDFNAFYDGYYPPRRLTAVCVTDQQVAIVGQSEQGVPVMSLSSGGDVWAERNLDYTDSHGLPSVLQNTPRAIIYEAEWERFLLACDGGVVMSIPACSHCNALFDLPTTRDLTALAKSGNSVLVVGHNSTIIPFDF